MQRLRPAFVKKDKIVSAQETEKYFNRVSRYTTSAFLRMKLGDALERRGLPPHIYESAEEAHAFLTTG
jgi:propionate CoA-transferase